MVDNRKPESVAHWPAFAAWWASRRRLVGPQEEETDVLWICADNTTGLYPGAILLGRSLCPGSCTIFVPQTAFCAH